MNQYTLQLLDKKNKKVPKRVPVVRADLARVDVRGALDHQRGLHEVERPGGLYRDFDLLELLQVPQEAGVHQVWKKIRLPKSAENIGKLYKSSIKEPDASASVSSHPNYLKPSKRTTNEPRPRRLEAARQRALLELRRDVDVPGRGEVLDGLEQAREPG